MVWNGLEVYKMVQIVIFCSSKGQAWQILAKALESGNLSRAHSDVKLNLP